MLKNISWTALLLTSSLLASCGGGSSSNANPNDVTGIRGPDGKFQTTEAAGERNFANLINNYAVGRPKKPSWAGYWWSYKGNGIASGAYGGGKSPAGKYDAARGGRSHSQAETWEVKNHGSGVPKVEGWWGHCNGWCAAAALLDEPRDDVRVNGITFSVADQKALISEAGMNVVADFFGDRVDFAQDFNTYKFDDTIPNQYFMVLTNYMGALKMGVNIDRYTGNEVWNQPLVGYRIHYPKPSDYVGASPDAPNIYRINVTSEIFWAEDGVDPNIRTPEFKFEDFPVDDGDAAQSTIMPFTVRTLHSELWLDAPVKFDASGKIVSSGNLVVARKDGVLVGGQWLGNSKTNPVDGHPDYMWVPYSFIPPQPDSTEEPYANPHVDIDWLKAHLLVPGGADDTSVTPGTPDPAPSISPHPSDSPTPTPSSTPSHSPTPHPTPTPTSTGTPTPHPTSTPAPRPTN